MTITQLSTFVLVARLGSVKAAASSLGVSEPAVSQALSALRQHFGDQLILRTGAGMKLTPAGARLLPVASRMVALGADAEAAVRAGQGAPEQLRLVATSPVVEFVAPPLLEAFTQRTGRSVECSAGVVAGEEMPVLVGNRLADVALGPKPVGEQAEELVAEPAFRARMVVVTGAAAKNSGRWHWLVDPSGTDPDSDSGKLLRRLRINETQVRVFPNQTAAWAAAADGAGVAPALSHLVSDRLHRGELRVVDTPATPMDATWYATSLVPERRSGTADTFLHFLHTAAALRVMREPGAGVPPSRFRPPVYVTLWS